MITAAQLRAVLHYDPERGIFRWLGKSNRQPFGRTAGSVTVWGYLRITIERREYFGHRLAWLYMTGKWPKGVVDHRNGDRLDNRFANLRDGAKWQNSANQRRTRISISGFTGVCRRAVSWEAHIEFRDRHVYLGSYPTPELAHAAYLAENRRLRGDFALSQEKDPLPALETLGPPVPLVRVPVGELTAVRLRSLLSYDAKAGIFKWRNATGNGRTYLAAGAVAGRLRPDGYRIIFIDGRHYRAARLVWLYVHGRWPERLVDHVNGVRDDDRLANLREASDAQNMRNGPGWGRRQAKLKGAYATTRGRPWRAVITVNKKFIHLGTFDTEAEAHAAYIVAAKKHFGEFARWK